MVYSVMGVLSEAQEVEVQMVVAVLMVVVGLVDRSTVIASRS